MALKFINNNILYLQPLNQSTISVVRRSEGNMLRTTEVLIYEMALRMRTLKIFEIVLLAEKEISSRNIYWETI